MKLKLFLIMVFLCGLCMADELETIQNSAMLVSSADSNDSALGVDGTSWVVAKTWKNITGYANNMKVKFYVYDPCGPNDATFDYQFYVADYGCNAELVADGNVVCGAAQMSHNPVDLAEINSGVVDPNYCWVDTLDVTEDWKGEISTQNNGGLNGVASFIFYRQCAKKAWCRIYSRSTATMIVYCVAYYY